MLNTQVRIARRGLQQHVALRESAAPGPDQVRVRFRRPGALVRLPARLERVDSVLPVQVAARDGDHQADPRSQLGYGIIAQIKLL